MMRVDAYTHFIPTRFFKEVMSAGNHRDIGKRMMGVPAIFDINVRRRSSTSSRTIPRSCRTRCRPSS